MKRVQGLKFKVQSSSTSAFTLVELLVVVAIIGILAALLLATLSSAKQRAIRVKCLNNVRLYNLGYLMYGQDNQDRLPVSTAPDDEPWAVSSVLLDMLKRYGVHRRMLYDPGNPQKDDDRAWNHEVPPPNFQGERSIGYVASLPGFIHLRPENINMRIVSEPLQVGPFVMPAPDPSRRVLVAGVVISSNGQNQTIATFRTTYNYSALETMDDWPRLARSSHLRGKMPAGDNQAMLDGSAKWQKFELMYPRSGPTFYTFLPTVWW